MKKTLMALGAVAALAVSAVAMPAPAHAQRGVAAGVAAGLIGEVAVLQRLYQRARSGAGAAVGAGLLNAGLFLLSELVQRSDGQFVGAAPLNHEQTGYHPAEQLYEAADGWLAVAARDAAMARRMLDALNLGQRITAPRD